MQVLLSGATGFLGSHLLPELLNGGHEVMILKRRTSDISRIKDHLARIKVYDLGQERAIERIFSGNKIDAVIHLATDYGKKNNNDVGKMSECIIGLPTELLKNVCKYSCPLFINTHTALKSNITLYAAMKAAFLKVADYFVGHYKFKFVNLTMQYIYGPQDDSTKFVSCVINNMHRNKVTPATAGTQKMDFVYVRDVVDAYLKVLKCHPKLKQGFTNFEIGTAKSTSLRSLVKELEKLAGKKALVKWSALASRQNEPADSKADITLARELLGWQAKVTLKQGLQEMLG